MKQSWIFIVLAVAVAAIIGAVAWTVCGTATAPGLAGYALPHLGPHVWGIGLFVMPLFFMLFCIAMAVGIFRGGSPRPCCPPHLGSRRHDGTDSNAGVTRNS